MRSLGILASGALSVSGRALWGPGAAVSIGRGLERRACGAVCDGLERAALAAVAAVLDSHLGAEVGRLLGASELAEQLITELVIGPIPDALESEHAGGAAERVASSRFVRQTVTATMSGDLIDRATEDAVRYAVVQRMGKQVLAEDALDQIVERLLQTPGLWMLVDRIADSHPVAQVLERQSDYIAQAIGEQMR
jgi:hypothetical protein